MTNLSNRQKIWLGIIISLVSLASIFLIVDFEELLNALKNARYGYLLLTLTGLILFLIVRAVRWQYMLAMQAPYKQVFHIQNIGYMLSQVLPLRLGDVARAVLIGRIKPVTIAQGISTTVIDRVLDMVFMIILLPFALANVGTLTPELRDAAQGFGFVAVVGMGVLIVAANQRPFTLKTATFILNKLPFLDTAVWTQRLDDLLQGLSSLTSLKDILILSILSIIVWIPIIFAYYTALLAANIQPTIPMAALTVVIAAIAVALPSSPGQAGVFHLGVTIGLTAIMKQPEDKAVTFAVLYHGLNMISLIIIGLIGLWQTGLSFQSVVTTARQYKGEG
jgi:hypothetical protein